MPATSTIELPEVYTRLWCVVVDFGQPVSLMRLRHESSALQVCREHHAKLNYVLERLVDRRHLLTDAAGKGSTAYWFGAACKTPYGQEPREAWNAGGYAIATSRQVTQEAASPVVTVGNVVRSCGLEHERHPSRRGNRLYWRNGRVTDLDGNAMETTT